jgi:cytochrome c biogenesis factor
MSVIFAPIISYFKKSIDKIVKKQLRLIVFTFSAVIFMLFGVFFVSSGLVEGVSLLIPRWMAFCIVGVFLGVIGYFIMVMGTSKKEEDETNDKPVKTSATSS